MTPIIIPIQTVDVHVLIGSGQVIGGGQGMGTGQGTGTGQGMGTGQGTGTGQTGQISRSFRYI